MKIKRNLKSLLSDERGEVSSKRCMGIMACLVLFFTLIVTTLSTSINTPSEALINAVMIIAVGCLGLSSVDKFSNKK